MTSSFKKSTFLETTISLSTLEQRITSERARMNPQPPSHSTERQKAQSLRLIEQMRKMREKELVQEHAATTPSHQFRAQVQAEATIRNNGAAYPVAYRDIVLPTKPILRPVVATIKQRWINQGIWSPEWNVLDMPGDQWKHESGISQVHPTESNVGNTTYLLRTLREPRTRGERRNSIGIMRQVLENRQSAGTESEMVEAANILLKMKRRDERSTARSIEEREASRPLYQFVHQLRQETRRISAVARPTDCIDVMAYDNIKKAWIENGLWDKNWGNTPGMKWKHEQPLKDFLLNDPAFMEACRLVDLGQAEAHRAS
ncbi:hypothetical protein CP533_0840 [Ophiocordyceps camponoti-saundersi (nom. inval.)]|nr:hypothetical protein CP533_0840 [Ophiocordyceps camponoti-saundersi (nom. inval.)]